MHAGKDAEQPIEVDELTSVGGLEEIKARRQKFAELTMKKRELGAQIKSIGKELDELEQKVIDDYVELGTTSMRTSLGDNNFTVHLTTDVFAGPLKSGVDDSGDPKSTEQDWEIACAALREIGLGELVGERFHAQSLGSWLKEFREEHGPKWKDDLPEEVAEALRLGERPRVRVRKG